MEHKHLYAVLGVIMAGLLVLSACSNPLGSGGEVGSEGNGAIVLVFNDLRAQTIVPQISLAIARYDVSFTRADFEPVLLNNLPGSTTRTEPVYLRPGVWTVTATASNASGVIIGVGGDGVEVQARRTTTISLAIRSLSGDGSLSLSADLSELEMNSPTVSGSLAPGAPGEVIPITLAISGSSGSYSGSIPAGTYLLSLELADGSTRLASYVDTVLIVAGHPTAGSLAFKPKNGSVIVELVDEITRPIAITLSGLSSTLSPAESMTVTATPAVAVDSYQWYLDGAAVSGETSSQITLGPGLEAGDRLLTVVVKKGPVYSSESGEFTVLVESGTVWARTYGGTDTEYGFSAQPVSTGGFIVAAQTHSFGLMTGDYWMLRLNAEGSIVWQKTFGGSGSDQPRSVWETADGGFIVAGIGPSFASAPYSSTAWLLRLNGDGEIVWQNAYGNSLTTLANTVQEVPGNGFIVGGITTAAGAGDYDYWLLRLDSGGGVLWQKTYGGSSSEPLFSMQITMDGGYIVAGRTNSFADGDGDFWVLKLDAAGTILWQKSYGGTAQDEAHAIRQTADGGFIVAGSTTSFGAGNYDYWVLRLDSEGEVVWQKSYGGSGQDDAQGIAVCGDGGFVISGFSRSYGAGAWDIWLVKLNGNGSPAWQRSYGGPGDDRPRSIQQLPDGSYIIAAETNSFGAGGIGDLWVLRVAADGSCGTLGLPSDVVAADTTAAVTDTTVSGVSCALPANATSVVGIDTDAVVMQQAP